MSGKTTDMCSGPLFGKIIAFSIPVVITSVLQLLFNAADLAVVGRFCGSLSVAAVGATSALINLIVQLFIGLSVGAGVSTAHAFGAKDSEELSRTVHTSIPTALLSGILLTVVGLLFAKPLLSLMGTPDDVLPLSAIYMKIYFCGMTSSMVYNFGAAILRAAGDTKGPLIYLTLAGVINIILNIFFVVSFHMDVAGVALATSISQTVSAVLVVLALMKRSDELKYEWSKMHIYGAQLRKIIKIGLPAGIQGSLFSISNVVIQSSVNSFGSLAVSANSAAASIEGFTFITMGSLHQAAINFVGQNSGAHKYDRVKKTMNICLASTAVLGVFLTAVTIIFSRPLLSIFISDSPEAIEIGVMRLIYVVLPATLCGLLDIFAGGIRGMGFSTMPMITTLVCVVGVRMAWVMTVFRLPEFHTLTGLYLCYGISWVIACTVQMIVYITCLRKKIREDGDSEVTE